jgi:exodeoxyribonuclease-3
MRIVSWNVNGLRAILKKNFYQSIGELAPDIVCLQEIRVDAASVPKIDLPGYVQNFNCSQRKGYSGTAIFSKIVPVCINCETPLDALTEISEGRVIVAEYEKFSLVNVYTPNSGGTLKRLAFRHEIWDAEMLKMVRRMSESKAVILCGDMNVAHREIDLSNPEANRFSAGFTDEERGGMDNLLKHFGVDTFRKFFPNAGNRYSWWSYRGDARARNIGWRIDYVIVSGALEGAVENAFIADQIFGSDHAPVGIDVNP